MAKKYWALILLISFGVLFIVVGCVSYLTEDTKDSDRNVGFYELDEEFSEYSQKIYIPPVIIPKPKPLPVIATTYISDSVSDFLDLAIHNDSSYAVYADAKNEHKLTVKIFDAGVWKNIGKNPITQDQAYWPNINIINNTPVVTYIDRAAGYTVSAKYFDQYWKEIYMDGLPKVKAGILKTHSANNKLLIAFSDIENNGIITSRWRNNGWETLTPISRYTHKIIDIDIVSINDAIYLAIIDKSTAYTIIVFKLVNEKWKELGNFSIIDYFAGDLSLSTDGKHPYISYITYKNAQSSCKVNVKKFDGKTWSVVGKPFSTPGKARFSELQISNNKIFLAYADLINKKPTVLQLKNNSWITLNMPEETLGKTSKLAHLIYKGFSYVAYIDESNHHRAIAMPLPLRKLF